MIRLSDVSKIYRSGDVQTSALKNINLLIEKGMFYVILGPSGSGKSTLLNVISGLDRVSSGSIIFGNKDLTRLSESEMTRFRRVHLGFIFQQYNLLQNLTVFENVQIGSDIGKNPLEIDMMLKKVYMEKARDKYPHQLSGGEQQRVSIARSLAKNPDIIFCDEPTGSLDEKNSRQVLDVLQHLNSEFRKTIVLITHNNGISEMADKVIRMNSGEITGITENSAKKSALDIVWGQRCLMLFKNVIRSLGKKWTQLAGLGIIILLSSFIFTMMSYGVASTEEPTMAYLTDYNQEDFSIEMLDTATEAELQEYPALLNLWPSGMFSLSDIKNQAPEIFEKIIQERIEAFEKENTGCSLELRQLKKIRYNYSGKSHSALIAKDAERIDLSYIEEGRKPESDNEIAICRIYAQKNGIEIGDTIDINSAAYQVTGFVLFPDYSLTMFGATLDLDTSLQTVMLMTDSAFENMSGTEMFRLAGKNLSGDKTYSDYAGDELQFVNEIVATDNALRSGAIYDAFSQNKAVAVGLSTFISLIAVIMVCVLINNLLNAEKAQIGILKALGYSNGRIMIPYFLPIVAFTLIIHAAGYYFGFYFSEYVRGLQLNFYLIPSSPVSQNLHVFVFATFVPVAAFAAVSFIVITYLIRKRTIDLLKPRKSKPIGSLSRFIGRLLKNAKGSTKFKYIHVFRNLGSFLIITIGVMFSTVLIYFAFMATGVVDKMTVEYLEKVDYAYEAYTAFVGQTTELREGDEKILAYQYAHLNDSVVQLKGLSADNKLYKLYDNSGNDITDTLLDGVAVTRRLSIKLNIKTGDNITVKIKDRFYDLTVKGIVDEYISDTVFMNIEVLSNFVSDNRSSDLFNGIYALTKPSEEDYEFITSKSDIMEQSEAMENHSRFMINVLIGCSSIIAASILFVLTSFTVESSYYDISLLKVLGYYNKEVNAMILNSYFVYTVLSYIASIPVALLVLKRVMALFVQQYGVVLPLEMEPIYGIVSVLVIVLVFFAGTYVSRRKISRISLQEIIKTYGE